MDTEDPDFEDSLELARALLAESDEGTDLWEANALINDALALRTSDASAWVLKSQIMSALEDDYSALAAAEMAIKRNPRMAEAHYWRGAVLGDLGRSVEALRAIDRAFQCVAPEDDWLLEELYYEKAALLAASGKDSDALATFDAGLARCPESTLLRAGLEPMRRELVRATFKVIPGGLR